MRACMSGEGTRPPLQAVVPKGMRAWGVLMTSALLRIRLPSTGSASVRRWRADGLQRSKGEWQARQHRLRLQQFQHGFAPGSEAAAGRHPAPIPTAGRAGGTARQERQRAGVGLVVI